MQNAIEATSYAVLHPKRLPVKLLLSSVRLLASLLTSSVTRHSDSLERSVIDTFRSAFRLRRKFSSVLRVSGRSSKIRQLFAHTHGTNEELNDGLKGEHVN